MNKIGLFGGTFDPVHIGHVKIAESFLRSAVIDELWILLTPFPPHKQTKDHADYTQRFEMLTLAFSHLDCKILTIENELPKPSYTYRTIQYLKTKHPTNEFYFCMGEDSLEKFDQWKHYEEILSGADLLVAKRPNADRSGVKKSILSQTTFVDHEAVQISSTEIKVNIYNIDFLKGALPKKVFAFIEKQKLYR